MIPLLRVEVGILTWGKQLYQCCFLNQTYRIQEYKDPNQNVSLPKTGICF
jgi:hypothetical protein